MDTQLRKTRKELQAEMTRLQEKIRTLEHAQQVSHSLHVASGFDEEELFALVPDVEGDELCLTTETGKIVYTNEAMCTSLGYTLEELLAMPLTELNAGTTRASWLYHVSRLKKSAGPVTFEVEHRTKDGAILKKELASAWVEYNGKKYVLCIGRILSITEPGPQPRPGLAEAAAGTDAASIAAGMDSAAPDRWSVLLNTIGEGVMVVDTRGIVVDANAAAARMMNMTRSDMLGRSCVDPRWRLVDARNAPLRISDHPVMVTMIDETPVTDRAVVMLGQDGAKRTLLINAAPLFDSSKTLTGAVASFRPAQKGQPAPVVAGPSASACADAVDDLARALSRAESVHAVERIACDLLVDATHSPLVWIGTLRSNDERVHQSTASGDSADFLLKVRVRYDDSDAGRGPIGACIRTGKPVVVPNLIDDPSSAQWRRHWEKGNLRSLAVWPLTHDGAIAGILCIYGKQKDAYDDEDLAHLADAVALFNFAWSAVRDRTEKHETAAELRSTREAFTALSDATTAGCCIFDARPPFRALTVNRHYLDMLDDPFRSKGVDGLALPEYIFVHRHGRLYDVLQEAADTGEQAAGTEEEFRWRVVPLHDNGRIDRLIYISQPLDPAKPGAELPGAAPAATAAPARSAAQARSLVPAASADPAVTPLQKTTPDQASLVVEMPVPAPRSRKLTRAQMLLREGTVRRWEGPVAAFFGSEQSLLRDGASAGDVIPAHSGLLDGVAEAFGAGDDGATFVYAHSDEGAIRVNVRIELDGGESLTVRFDLRKEGVGE